jgi:hypothetical protein
MSVVDGLVTAISAEDTAEFGALYADDAILHEPLYPEPVIGRQAIVEGEAGQRPSPRSARASSTTEPRCLHDPLTSV